MCQISVRSGWFLALLALFAGCGDPAVDKKAPSASANNGAPPVPAAVVPTEVKILQPDAALKIAPNTDFNCIGSVKGGDPCIVRFDILKGKTTAYQAAGEKKAGTPEGTYHASLKSPVDPGKYTLRVVAVCPSGETGQVKGKPASPSKEHYSETIEIEVAKP